jgi:hypothetical protein
MENRQGKAAVMTGDTSGNGNRGSSSPELV